MADLNYARRRVDILKAQSTTSKGAGPYEEVFAKLKRLAPMERQLTFGRRIRVSDVRKIDDLWFLSVFLVLDKLEILEISAEPDAEDSPTFAVPQQSRSFATRTCGLFNLNTRICAVEYVRSGPKIFDIEEILSNTADAVTKKRESHFALTPLVEGKFVEQIEAFDQIRQVRAVFERPNPGWGDISILSDDLDNSGDAKRELVMTAPRAGSLRKNKGIVQKIKNLVKSDKSPLSDVIVEGRKPGEAGITRISSKNSRKRHTIITPVTDDEKIYRRTFIQIVAPFLAFKDHEN
jgi:hypothetical protein